MPCAPECGLNVKALIHLQKSMETRECNCCLLCTFALADSPSCNANAVGGSINGRHGLMQVQENYIF